jgi:hypothetical protein
MPFAAGIRFSDSDGLGQFISPSVQHKIHIFSAVRASLTRGLQRVPEASKWSICLTIRSIISIRRDVKCAGGSNPGKPGHANEQRNENGAHGKSTPRILIYSPQAVRSKDVGSIAVTDRNYSPPPLHKRAVAAVCDRRPRGERWKINLSDLP